MEPPDWDLLAVVRGCSSAAPPPPLFPQQPPPPPPPPPLFPQQPPPPPPPPPPAAEPTYETRPYGAQSLLDVFKPFFPNLEYKFPTPAPLHPAADFPLLPENLPPPPPPPKPLPPPQLMIPFQPPQQILFQQPPQQINLSPPTSTAVANSPTHHRPAKKRKTLKKKEVCQVPAEGLTSDIWAWRKYGQKPIKGSPYPRGYYKCSTTSLCPARKMVERSRSDPTMFIVTYTSEHNHPVPVHRNSLSGSTRKNKPAAAGSSSSPTASLSPTKDDSGDEMDFPEEFLTDEFFAGFEDIVDDDAEFVDGLPDPVLERLEAEFSWKSGGGDTSSAAAAAGGG